LFGGISDAGGGQGDAGSGGENGGAVVISVGVDGAQLFGRRGRRGSNGCEIGLATAANAGVEDCSAPSSTEEENRRKRDGDVAGDGHAGDRGLGGIGVTGGGHLYFAAGEGLRGRKDSIGGDGANLRGAAEISLTLQKTKVSEVL